MAPSQLLVPSSGFLFNQGKNALGWGAVMNRTLNADFPAAYTNQIGRLGILFLDGAAVPDTDMLTTGPMADHVTFAVGGWAYDQLGGLGQFQGGLRLGSSPAPNGPMSSTWLNFTYFKPPHYADLNNPRPPANAALAYGATINFVGRFRYMVFCRPFDPTFQTTPPNLGQLFNTEESTPPWRRDWVPLACWDFGDEYEMVPDDDGNSWGQLEGVFASIDHGTPKIVAGSVPAGYPDTATWVGNAPNTNYPAPIGRLNANGTYRLQPNDGGPILNYPSLTKHGVGFDLSSAAAPALLRGGSVNVGMVTGRNSGPLGIALERMNFRARRVRIGVHDATDVAQEQTLDELAADYSLEFTADKVTRISMPRPVVLRGLPHQPLFGITQAPSSSVVLTGPGHVRPIDAAASSDPLWDPDAQKWIIHPPLGGTGKYRWTTRQVPWPNPLPTKAFLGASVAGDPPRPASLNSWPAAPAPNFAAADWVAKYPCRPALVNYVHYRSDVEPVQIGVGVSMRADQAEHMFTLGASLNPPLTWIMVAVVTRFPGVFAAPNATFIDEGADFTTDLGTSVPDPPTGRLLVPSEAKTGPRITMGLDPDEQLMVESWPLDESAVDPLPSELGTQSVSTSRLCVYAGVWNGASSIVANWSAAGGRHLRFGQISPTGGVRTAWLLGRRNGAVDPEGGGLDAVVFEIRAWTQALNVPQLDAQAAQLLQSWRSNAFT